MAFVALLHSPPMRCKAGVNWYFPVPVMVGRYSCRIVAGITPAIDRSASPLHHRVRTLRNSAVAIDVAALLGTQVVGGLAAVAPGKRKKNVCITVHVGRTINEKSTRRRVCRISCVTIRAFIMQRANMVQMPDVFGRKRMADSACLGRHYCPLASLFGAGDRCKKQPGS